MNFAPYIHFRIHFADTSLAGNIRLGTWPAGHSMPVADNDHIRRIRRPTNLYYEHSSNLLQIKGWVQDLKY